MPYACRGAQSIKERGHWSRPIIRAYKCGNFGEDYGIISFPELVSKLPVAPPIKETTPTFIETENQMSTKTTYIAGPMTGLHLYNFPAFDRAQERLEECGANVISPAQMDRDNGFDPRDLPEGHDWSSIPDGCNVRDFFDRDIAAIRNCDEIYMLDGWENSKGARAELACAQWLGLGVYYQSDPSPRSVIPDGPFPENSAERKKYPVFSGVLMYFPEAMAALALRSFESQAEHNPTGRIEWIKEKSIGDGNEIVRHLMESEIAYLNGDYVTAAEEAAAVHWRGAEFHQRMLTGIEPFERK